MKQLLFTFALAAFTITSLFAQGGDQGLKDATKAFNAFKLDSNNKGKLSEAADAIDKAADDPATNVLFKTWQLRGDIYNEIGLQLVNTRTLVAQGLPTGDISALTAIAGPAMEAAASYEQSLKLAVKKYETKDALKGMFVAQGNLQNLGYAAYEEQDFNNAFEHFRKAYQIHETLVANNEASLFDTPEKVEDWIFYVGLAGSAAGKQAESKPYFLKLYEMKANKPSAYVELYNIESAEKSPEEAYKYLEEGKKLFPDDASLLFAQINHFLKIGKLEELIDQIKQAIAIEPTNVSLYTTMGSVYDNLYQNTAATDKEKAENYAMNALDYFNKALEIEPGNFDAQYSIGALYYNKAAAMTQELNKLADDYSKAGLAKFEAKQKEVLKEFDNALPYFKKCEQLNPNDTNTLIALKEIFAKQNNLELSTEFKARLEKVQAGEKNEKSYF
jgi:tetratricopeptide (TPR) repeat protein